jgi:hypothetical protein
MTMILPAQLTDGEGARRPHEYPSIEGRLLHEVRDQRDQRLRGTSIFREIGRPILCRSDCRTHASDCRVGKEMIAIGKMGVNGLAADSRCIRDVLNRDLRDVPVLYQLNGGDKESFPRSLDSRIDSTL